MEKITKKWLERAQYDLSTAKVMLESHRYLYVTFMCQQALEKILKAILIQHDQEAPRIHNLVRLAELAKVYHLLADTDQEFLANLTPFAIESRYGDYKRRLSEIVDKKAAHQYFKESQRIFQCLKRILNKSKS